MNYSSSKASEYTTTVRPPQDWGSYRLSKAKHVVTSKGDDKLVLSWNHPNSGTDFDHWLNITLNDKGIGASRKDMQIFMKIVELNGLNFEDAGPADLAKLIAANVSAMDLKIAWGDGDGTFVNDVAMPGTQAGQTVMPLAKPEPATPATVAAGAKKKVDW